SDDPKGAFFLVKLLEDSQWPGMRHFDSHAYRTEDEAGVWDFAAGSMRTYLILKEKVARFNADPEIQQLLAEADGGTAGARVTFSELRNTKFDLAALRWRSAPVVVSPRLASPARCTRPSFSITAPR